MHGIAQPSRVQDNRITVLCIQMCLYVYLIYIEYIVDRIPVRRDLALHKFDPLSLTASFAQSYIILINLYHTIYPGRSEQHPFMA